NVTPNPGHWLALKLTGTHSNRDGIGATIVVTLPSGRQLSNHCTTSVGYASSSEPLVRFGLGKDTVAKLIQIHWLIGASQDLPGQVAASATPPAYRVLLLPFYS